jgi:hypothetical protein
MAWDSGTYVEWRIEVKRVWEDEEGEWGGTHGDSLDTHMMKRNYAPEYDSYRTQTRSTIFGFGPIWYETLEAAKAAVQRFLDGPEPYWHDNECGYYFTDAHYEIRIRKVTVIVDEPIVVVEPVHPALLRKKPETYWRRRSVRLVPKEK